MTDMHSGAIRSGAIRCGVAGLVLAVVIPALGVGPRKAGESARTRLPDAVLEPASTPVMDLPPIDRSTRPAIHQAASRIDALVEKVWREHGARPGRPLSDTEFLRRIFLEIAGRIPSYDEAVEFLGSRQPAKRPELVDALLESPDYVSHLYNFWADVLRLQERPDKHLVLEPYLFYVKDSIRANTPYDQWVKEMLTADGRPWESPAVGFQLRDDGMPLPYVDNTVRVFLGTQIGCAQCHDHPFDRWTQREFYELAAFTAGTHMRPGGDPVGKAGKGLGTEGPVADAARVLREENMERNLKNRAAVTLFIRMNVTSVSFVDRELQLPHDYQYDDGRPLESVERKVLWGEVPDADQAADGRRQFAAWVISRDNRQFARTIANRMWKKVMGVGLVEPADDFREDNPPTNPELLEHLTDEMLRLRFDLREFTRMLVSTEVYQRRAVLHDPTAGQPFLFPGPALRRMTAEQLWDSILTLVARNHWTVQRPTPREIAAVVSLDIEKATLADVDRRLEAFKERYGRQGYRRRFEDRCGYEGLQLVRASELPTPLPLGHFLRQFGQSDREAIEGGRSVATVPQILAMFNGPITHSMLAAGSVIYDNVVSRPPQDAVDVVFLSVLSRRPSPTDRRLALDEIVSAETPAVGCGNVIWALLNTREFLFIQ
jgi:hypothetical protein